MIDRRKKLTAYFVYRIKWQYGVDWRIITAKYVKFSMVIHHEYVKFIWDIILYIKYFVFGASINFEVVC
jgi:hypothetical protein